MIDKEIIKQALNDIKIFGIENTYGVDVLKDLAELYLAGKLVEPLSKEEIEKIIKDFEESNLYDFNEVRRKKLAEALVA